MKVSDVQSLFMLCCSCFVWLIRLKRPRNPHTGYFREVSGERIAHAHVPLPCLLTNVSGASSLSRSHFSPPPDQNVIRPGLTDVESFIVGPHEAVDAVRRFRVP